MFIDDKVRKSWIKIVECQSAQKQDLNNRWDKSDKSDKSSIKTAVDNVIVVVMS